MIWRTIKNNVKTNQNKKQPFTNWNHPEEQTKSTRNNMKQRVPHKKKSQNNPKQKKTTLTTWSNRNVLTPPERIQNYLKKIKKEPKPSHLNEPQHLTPFQEPTTNNLNNFIQTGKHLKE